MRSIQTIIMFTILLVNNAFAQVVGGAGVDNITITPGGLVKRPSATNSVSAGTAITVTHSLQRIEGNGGAVIVTATPSVADGIYDGQKVVLQGMSDANPVTLQDLNNLPGSGLKLSGRNNVTLGNDDTITLIYHLAEDHWMEVSRAIPSIDAIPTFKNYTFSSPAGTSGTFYVAGFFEAPTTSVTLTQASPTVTVGGANVPYEAHAFIVAGGAGTASGGAGTPSIVVSGNSWQDDGTLTLADSETIVSDITALSLNEFAETAKKWVGTTTYTLTCTGGCTHTTYSVAINYGLNKYEDFGNRDFSITDMETIGLAGANDAGFNIELVKQADTGWTYAAAGFVPGNSVLLDMASDHGADNSLVNGENFTYKRSGLSLPISGSGSEGFVIRITTTANNAVRIQNTSVGVLFD